ncbi:hypothetical protein [Streptomyces sp. cmx-4-9]|uniref:hypothetical protein n=1 Tax=Streptomyces sp. cmx-4-9 TaxID=2790941 RepID=UPI00397EFAC6
MKDTPLTELHRIESDPACRAQFRALLDAALVRRAAEQAAFARAATDAAHRLRSLLCGGAAEDDAEAGRRGTVTVTLGAVAWTCFLAFAVARGRAG